MFWAILEEKTSYYYREKGHDKHQKDISPGVFFSVSSLFCVKCLITVSFLKDILLWTVLNIMKIDNN